MPDMSEAAARDRAEAKINAEDKEVRERRIRDAMENEREKLQIERNAPSQLAAMQRAKAALIA